MTTSTWARNPKVKRATQHIHIHNINRRDRRTYPCIPNPQTRAGLVISQGKCSAGLRTEEFPALTRFASATTKAISITHIPLNYVMVFPCLVTNHQTPINNSIQNQDSRQPKHHTIARAKHAFAVANSERRLSRFNKPKLGTLRTHRDARVCSLRMQRASTSQVRPNLQGLASMASHSHSTI